MKNQIYALARVSFRALGMLAVFVSVSACTDDYTLDDEKPEWLGESVYQKLENSGNFVNYIRLMDDLGMKEVLSRTGSRTVFAANDEAFNTFYEGNRNLPSDNLWHGATSYDELSASQKLLLAKSTMLNNAITMETLSTEESSLERGSYLRRPTLVSIADTVTHLKSNQLPYSYNLTGDKDYWAQFRSNTYTPGNDPGSGPGIIITDGDGTSNMMLCFTAEQMAKNNVTDDDFELVMGEKRDPLDVFVYDAKIIEQDITCQNGYINMLGKVVRPLPNMAEVIRTNPDTKIFSHILERFSAPVYVESYNEFYRLSHTEFEDTIYTKWYFSPVGTNSLLGEKESSGKPVYFVDYNGERCYHVTQGAAKSQAVNVPAKYSLKFDPSWNACMLVEGEKYPESDMAAMFVPDDETLFNVFMTGSLHSLIVQWTRRNIKSDDNPTGLEPEVGEAILAESQSATLTNLEPLFKALDQVPMDVLQALVNNLMMKSYNMSVKSKFATLKNDAMESLFGTADNCKVKRVDLACNGAVYVTTSYHAPADYSSVAAPAFLNTDKLVLRYAIYNGSNPSEVDNMRGLNYYAYLKAMTSRFTLFLPDDTAMLYTYQPMSFKCKNPHMAKITYHKSGQPLRCEVWDYDIDEAYISGTRAKTNPYKLDDIAGILTDVLQTHTLVHENDAAIISQTAHLPNDQRDQYFVTKSNDAIKVTYNKDDGSVEYIQGGFQIENEQAGHEYVKGDDKRIGTVRCYVKDRSLYSVGGGSNGDTYVLEAPAIPAVKTVSGVLKGHDAYKPFYDLCTGVDADILEACDFFKNEDGEEVDASERLRLEENIYAVFLKNKKGTLDDITAFFNQYLYTVFVPTGEALDQARAEGYLFTWDDIKVEFDAVKTDNPNYNGTNVKQRYLIEDADARTRLKAKIVYLFNFIRFHFMDSSVFADNTAWSANNDVTRQNYATSCFYQTSPTKGNFMKLHIKRNGHGQMTVQGLNIDMNDVCGDEATVQLVSDPTNGVPLYNRMAREILVVDPSNVGANIDGVSLANMKDKRIGSSSSAVIHLIDKTLRYMDTPPHFDSTAEARRYLKYNGVVNKYDIH